MLLVVPSINWLRVVSQKQPTSNKWQLKVLTEPKTKHKSELNSMAPGLHVRIFLVFQNYFVSYWYDKLAELQVCLTGVLYFHFLSDVLHFLILILLSISLRCE
jgi:hypothetical protein